MAGRKKKSEAAPTRELFSDDATQAETQTTRLPATAETRPQEQRGTPPYLERRPVKFINIPVGGFFVLNGDSWQKIDANRGQHFIKIPGHEAVISGGIANFAPCDFVFLIPVTEDSRP